jgi:transposase
LVDVALFRVLKRRWPIFERFGLLLHIRRVRVRVKLGHRRCLAYDNIVSEHLNTRWDDSILV